MADWKKLQEFNRAELEMWRPDRRRAQSLEQQAWNVTHLDSLRDKHKGERAFILGMGPSLKIQDLERLKNEVTFGCNKIFLAYPEMSFRPTYYFVLDYLVGRNNVEAIKAVGHHRFLDHRLVELFPDLSPGEVTYIYNLGLTIEFPTGFSRDPVRGMYCGGTVLYHCLQMAHWMGIRKVFLLGLDFHFDVPPSTGRKFHPRGSEIVEDVGAQNHFHPDYRAPREEWFIPKFDVQEGAFRAARKVFAVGGGEIVNASRRTKLEVFPLTTLNKALASRKSFPASKRNGAAVCLRPWSSLYLYFNNVVRCCNMTETAYGRTGRCPVMLVRNCPTARNFRKAMVKGEIESICEQRCSARTNGQGVLWAADSDKEYFDQRAFEYIDEDSPFGENIRLQRRELEEGIVDTKTFPTILEILWSARCNLKCVMCSRWKQGGTTALNKNRIREIEEMLPYLHTLRISGGEPLVEPDCVDFISRFTPERTPHGRLTLYTNGTLLNQAMLRRFKKTSWDTISFSVDGVEKETFESIRVGADFRTVYNNMIFTQRCAREREWRVKLRVHFVVMEKNFRELPRLPEFVKSLGSSFRPSVCMVNDAPKGLMLNHREDLREELSEAIEGMEKGLKANGFAREIGQAQVKTMCGIK